MSVIKIKETSAWRKQYFLWKEQFYQNYSNMNYSEIIWELFPVKIEFATGSG